MNSTAIESSSSPDPSLETSISVNESDASTTLSTPTTTSNPTDSSTGNYSTNISTTSNSTNSSTNNYSTNISTTSNSTNSSTNNYSTSISTTSDPTNSLTNNYSTSSSTNNYSTSDPTSSSTNDYSTSILTTPYSTSSSTTNCSTSSSTTDYPSSSEVTTATSIPNLTDRSPARNLSGDVGLIFGGIIGSLSLITIVIIVAILIHKRIHHRRGSSYRPKSKGVKVLPTKDNVGNYKASKVLGGRYEDIDLSEGLSENATQNDQTLTETQTENYCYVNPKTLESVEAADSIYHHLGTDGSNEPVRDDTCTYHHIDVNFQPCQPSTDEYKNQRDSELGGGNNNYDHIHLAASKSEVQNPNYSHIEVNNIRSEKCDSNYDHISVPQQVPSNHRRNDNYHHIGL